MTVDSQTKRLFESLGADRIGSQFDSINNAIRIRNEFGHICRFESGSVSSVVQGVATYLPFRMILRSIRA